MKKNFGVKLLVVGLSLFSLVYLSEDGIAANASDNEKSNSVIPNLENGDLPLEKLPVNANERNTTVTNRLRHELRDLSFNLNRNAFQNGDISSSGLISLHHKLSPLELADTPFARVNNDMVLQNGETLAAHNASLSNQTETQQTMSTASFVYTQTDSVTTSTTQSTGVSMTTSAEMRFPFVSGSMSMTVEYDFGTTNSVESTVEKEWMVPSQHILVPAGHRYDINWILNTGVATGTTNLTSSINANIPYKMQPPFLQVWLIGDAIAEQDRLVAAMPSTQYRWGARNDWERISNTNALRTWGTSRYRAQLGTELIMKITDVTNPNAPVEVQEIPMNVTPVIVD
ncbi:ETX/MTX2 family pore-forming toxin [Carnobacterium sp. FSL E2-0243]|uniref:ETX/MTX2 family pore-forming toxin n=1 Tax=Carnobacterium sp. FSL E2-0243 TaxID=2921365 RepID=UPI0030FA67B2